MPGRKGKTRSKNIRTSSIIFVGVDLAASEKRQTGLCLLQGSRTNTEVVLDNAQLLRLESLEPTYIGIDVPF